MKQFLFLVLVISVIATANSLEFESEESSIDDSTSARAAKPQAPLNPFSAIFRDAFEPIFHSELHPDFFRNADEGETIFTKANEDVDEFSNKEPLDLDYVSGVIGPSSRPPSQRPVTRFPSPPGQLDDTSSSLFGHHFGTFFNGGFGFPGFQSLGGFGGFNTYTPWWKGANVCTSREEDVEEPEQDKKEKDEDKEVDNFGPFSVSSFNLNIESCSETNNKRTCKKITNVKGRKHTVTINKQCCHGFARGRNGGACEKVDYVNVAETAEILGGKQFVKSAINNDLKEIMESNITVFMPLDERFMEFSEQMFENNLVVMPLMRRARQANLDVSGIRTKDLVLNHIVKGWVDVEDIQNEQILNTEFEKSTIRMNVFPKLQMYNQRESEEDVYPYLYTANCVPIVKPNKIASNGIVHMVDQVLMPVTKTVMELISERDDMTVFRTVLEKTNLGKYLAGTHDENGVVWPDNAQRQVSIFAPSDSAFEKLDPQLRRKFKEGSACAANILKNHILDMTFCSGAVAGENAKTSTFNLMGEKMLFQRVAIKRSPQNENQTEETTTRSQAEDEEQNDYDILINDKAKIVEFDIMGKNGVLHVIDSILPTESGLPISTMLGNHNLTTFKKLMEFGNFDETLDNLMNATYFVPSDNAFAESVRGKYWLEQLENSPQNLKNNPELKQFLNYHIAQPLTKTCDLSEKMLDTLEGESLRVNLYTTLPVFVNVMNRATVNCARLVHFDEESCGSIVHTVDKVLEPPTQTLLEMLEANPQYSMFYKLLQQANLTESISGAEDSFTIFVPKDDVFLEVAEWYKDMLTEKNEQQLSELMQTHIVPDVLCCAGIARTEWPFLRTVETVNKKTLRLNRDRRPLVQNAGITKCDQIGKNGIIHEINDIIEFNRKPSQGQHNQGNQNIYQNLFGQLGGNFNAFPF